MSLLKAVESIPRKTTVVFLVIDISPSLTEQKLQVFLEAVGELKDTLSLQSESMTEYQVKIAALQFDSLCTWVPKTGPVETAQFSWQIPFAGKPPAVGFEEMCNTLNEELSKKRFMSDIAGYYPPVIVLFSGTDYTGTMNDGARAAALEALQKLHKNNWFKYADKCAVALGRTTDKGFLAQWTGDEDTVLSANTPSALRRVIASINMPRLSMPARDVCETEHKTGAAPATPKENPPPLMNSESLKYADPAREYKKSLSRNFISLGPHKIDEYLGNGIFFVTRKYDGELALLFYENEKLHAVNSRGAPLPDLPCRKETVACLRDAGIRQGVFAAELYVDESRGRTRVFDTIAALAEPGRHGSLRFAFFDILSLNGADWRKPFEETRETLSKIFNADSCAPVRCEKVSSKEKVKELFDQWVTREGGEGLVIRGGGQTAIKIKPRMTVDAAVIGFSESEARSTVRTLLYALRKEDGSYQVIGRTGNGLSGEQKQELFTRLMPLKIFSNYIEVDSNHAVFHIIKPELVLELSANDVLCETASGT
ncbi:MAG: DNA ligase, partial [Treponema sp.]|nr:DNA ligase [Treponema sp.]